MQFDRQFFTDTPVTVRLDGVTIEQALQQVLSANGHFYKVLNQNTIIVAQDNAQAHAKYDDLVVRVFYLSHSDPTEISQIINTVMRIPTAAQPALFPNKTANTITVRGDRGDGGSDRQADSRERQAARRGGDRRPDPRGQSQPDQGVRASI